MRSAWEFLLVALVVTLTPGPATALVLRVAARDGRRAALGTIVGNEIGVLTWALLSAVGVSSLIVASELAYDVLRFGGAAVLVVLGVRSLFHRTSGVPAVPRWTGWKTGLLSSAANPKLAVFFIALFPQFLSPHSAVLPAALAMAGVIVLLDFVWFGLLAWTVDRAGRVLRPRIRRVMERTTGGVMLALGLKVAAQAR
ncbi:MAG TPA: LysE family translocator [Jatrophihabitans sp.]|jgi:threonine/homoserine/homoserine lactone efflux protein